MRYPGGLIASSPVNAAYPSGVWTQAQTQPYAAQNVWMRDQFWPNTTLLLQGNGTNGAQNNTFLDSSTNNFTITRNGNTTQGSFTPYEANGYWSNYFDGNGDFLSIADNAAFTLGSGDWTIEAWVFTGASATQKVVAGQIDSGGTTLSLSFQLDMSSTDYPRVIIASGTTLYIATSSSTLPKNQWVHLAGVRDGNTMRIYVNGVQTGTQGVTGVTVNDSSSNVGIGRHGQYAGLDWDGYISNLRLVKGTCVYPSGTTFIPSAAPLTAITNTSLLTCQSNRLIDNSTNAFAVTVNGTPSVQAFQPFPGATTWSGSVLGGSGYFDGSGDNLRAGNNSAFDFGTGSFTLEAWVYPTAATPNAYGVVLAQEQSSGTAAWGVSLALSPSNVPTFFASASSGSYAVQISGSSAPMNAWTHLAAVRNGNTFTLYVNGVSAATTTSTVSITQGSSPYGGLVCGGSSAVAALQFVGMISNARVVNGSAVYTAGFTPPTAPITAITNTQLLLNFTNAGIFDSAMMNDLETVGNAQVSTSVVKYGTGSMAFDGTGDFLLPPSSVNNAFGTGDFTIEMWAYVTSTASFSGFCGTYANTAGTTGWWLGNTNTGLLRFEIGNGAAASMTISSASAIPTNTWIHVAVVRSGTAVNLYLNGTSVTSGTSSANLSQTVLVVGRIYNNLDSSYMTGYLDDLRITKGAARYIGNFTPPVARMPQQ
jgi:hypothetical protein